MPKTPKDPQEELTPAIPFEDVLAWFRRRTEDSERALRQMPKKYGPKQAIVMPGEIPPPEDLYMDLDELY